MIIIGHRGAKGLAPENTVAAIKAGIAAGADWIELDVRSTADGQAVVIHDATTARVTKKRLVVAQTTLADLQKVLVDGKEKIPTLHEAFAAASGKAKINAEVKAFQSRQAILSEAKRVGLSSVMISSFSKAILLRVLADEPRAKVALLQAFNPFAFRGIKGLFGVGFHHLFAPRSAIALAKKQGLFTYVYTVDDPDRARMFATRGIDAVVTNFPNKLK